MVGAIIKSELKYFDRTPMSEILNRFSNDISVIDVLFFLNNKNSFQCINK
jgi:hypothetical protein